MFLNLSDKNQNICSISAAVSEDIRLSSFADDLHFFKLVSLLMQIDLSNNGLLKAWMDGKVKTVVR